MIRRSRSGHLRRLAIATVTAGLAVPLLASAGSAQAAHTPAARTGTLGAPDPATLICAMRTAPKFPITFTPPLRDAAAQPTEARGVILLERCSSPNGKAADIASGRLEITGSATASCRSATNVRGTGTVTWQDAQGKSVGTSKLTTESSQTAGSSPTDSLLSGSVSSGRLSGRQVGAMATPTTDLGQCTSPSGLSELSGAGRLSFT